ncbi:hypothetical protein [Gracilibacillus dipsosauri]|uniref:Uncharacterized protein n=1 Tax=Gracilibacillus dipsosauri TaxID=178340 RepID=A0A317KSK6_9BACI|nr:hypothetical protein [Gracilibacillus dipsosauri]PWU66562.1 hypothetical protein DLJ74_19250 [Gracilibacillus dipsosauri]
MRTTGQPLHLQPKHDWIFCLENLELAFEKEAFERILSKWNEGSSVEWIAKQERRQPLEILLCLIDHARRGRRIRPFARKIG